MGSLSAALSHSPWPAPATQSAPHQWLHPLLSAHPSHSWPAPASAPASDPYPVQYAAYSAPTDYDQDYPQQHALDPASSYHAFSQPASSTSSQISSPRFQQAADWDTDLYRSHPDLTQDAHEDLISTVSLSPSPPPQPSSPRVKEEDTMGDGFIFDGPTVVDLCSLSHTPMTTVPLRATHASKAMRRLMGVFRLNPFAINSTSARGKSVEKDTDYSGEKIGPLKQPGREFRFQLEQVDAPKPEPEGSDAASPSRDRSPSPGVLLSYPEREEDSAALQQPESEASSQTSMYSTFTNESSSFVPTPAHSLGWLKCEAGSSTEGSSYSDSPPLRAVHSSPYLSSSRELGMPDLHRHGHSRISSYSASPPLRLPPPTPSARHISMAQIQSNDHYAEESEGSWYSKNMPLSNSNNSIQKDETLSSNAALPMVPAVNSLANATKYRPLFGTRPTHPYSSVSLRYQ